MTEFSAVWAYTPSTDSDAQRLASQIKRDPELQRIRMGQEQLNLIGYSGGATIAFDAAAILQRSGIYVDNVVGLGGFTIRGRPGNVVTWIWIEGGLDPLASYNPFGGRPDVTVFLPELTHYPFGPIPSYLEGEGRSESLVAMIQYGVR